MSFAPSHLLVVGWCAVAVGISASDGRYSVLALVSVLVGAAAVSGAVWGMRRSGREDRLRLSGHARPAADLARWLPAAVVALGPILRHPRYYAQGPWADVADALAVAAGLLAAAAIVIPAARGADAGWRGLAHRCSLAGLFFWVSLGLAVAAGVATVVASPAPRIDVWHLLQVSTQGLVQGENMYTQQWGESRATYTAGGLFDVYPYLPGTSLLLAPFRLLVGDVRYGLLAALGLAAVTVRVLALRSAAGGRERLPAASGLGLLIVVFPESMYALEQSWTEPLLVACLAGMVWAVAIRRPGLAVVALALALASKQHVALLVPLVAVWPAVGPRRALAACGLAVAVVLPWLVAAPRDLIDDAVRTNLGYEVLDHALSIPGWAHHFGITLSFAATALVLGGAYALAWRARGDAAGFCAGAALVLLALNLMNKQTFFNHYTLPMALLVLALAVHGAGGSGGPPSAAAVPRPGFEGQSVEGQSVEKRSSEAPSYRLRRSTWRVRSRSDASWSESTAQAVSRNR